MFLPALLLLLTPLAVADTVEVTDAHYRVYTSDGTPASFDDIRAAVAAADVIFVGENHNDPVAHAVELWTYQAALSAPDGRPAAVSMEMFARDVQYIVNEYLSGAITESHFTSSSSPWSNYATDYRPFVEAAKEAGMHVIAANAPRRYANLVTREGRGALQRLSDRAFEYMAPMPYGNASDRYRAQWDEIMGAAMGGGAATHTAEPEEAEEHEHAEGEEHEHAMEGEDHAAMHAQHMAEAAEAAEVVEEPAPAPAPEHPGMPSMENMLQAQVLWDATMAYSIAEHLLAYPNARVVHMVGGFHVATGTGTPEHLLSYRPSTRTLVIAVEPVDDMDTFNPDDHAGLGDFVILSDASLPRSYDTRTR